jgi:hypothetical protein
MTWVSRASRLFDGAAAGCGACFSFAAISPSIIDSPMRHGDALVTPKSDVILTLRGAGRRYPLSRVTNPPAGVAPIESDSTAPDVAPFSFGENGPGLTCGGTGIGRDRALMGMRACQRYPADWSTLARCCRGWLVLARNEPLVERRATAIGTSAAESSIAIPPDFGGR